jgi:spermidine/putrescine ABC transporter ATP-binding subunit
MVTPGVDTKVTDVAVRLTGVEKSFDGTLVLPPLDLAIPRAAFVSLLGPSGCGKTTTLRLVAGFERPDRGEIEINGVRVTGLPAYKRNFGMVFQHLALFPHLSVADNVGFGLKMRGVTLMQAATRIGEALQLVHLEGLADRFPKQLSGGQQQRVALARAIVIRPDVLLLDEPLGALDKMLREEMQFELRRLQRALGITTIFVTHDQEEALTMSDLVCVMRDGRIEQTGEPRQIYERPRTEFVATFLGASNVFEGVVAGREGDATVVRVRDMQLEIAGQYGATGTKLRLAVRPEKVRLSAEGSIRATIVDVAFRGPQTHVHLDWGGASVMAFLGDAAGLDLSPGRSVALDFEGGSVAVLQ